MLQDAPMALLSGAAVLREWPDGSHDLVRLSASAEGLPGWVAADAAYWGRGSFQPAYSIVVVSVADFDGHRGRGRRCRSPLCRVGLVPAATGLGGALPQASLPTDHMTRVRILA